MAGGGTTCVRARGSKFKELRHSTRQSRGVSLNNGQLTSHWENCPVHTSSPRPSGSLSPGWECGGQAGPADGAPGQRPPRWAG